MKIGIASDHRGFETKEKMTKYLIEKGYDVGVLDLKEAIMGLEESEIALITSRYYQDMTQKETADILGLSQVQVSRKESKILEKLKSKVA